jgi:hypothetical protein
MATNPFTTALGKQNGIDLLNANIQWHYGATEPVTTYPFQNWGDTGNNLWKQRNEADNGWITKGILNLGFVNTNGWIPLLYTCAYSSADDPTYVIIVEGNDLTGLIQAGYRFKCTQVTGGIKFFIITKVELSGSDTLITLFGGTGANSYDLNNEVISSPYWSNVKIPFGFPFDPEIWSIIITDSADRSQADVNIGTYYNLGTTNCQINIAIGLWEVEFCAHVIFDRNTAGSNVFTNIALSTSNNSVSDTNLLLVSGFTAGSSDTINTTLFRKINLLLTVKTLYYLIGSAQAAGTLTFKGSTVPTKIIARCAYL